MKETFLNYVFRFLVLVKFCIKKLNIFFFKISRFLWGCSPLILGLKDEKQLRNKNRTEDWALGCQPRDNGQVTH